MLKSAKFVGEGLRVKVVHLSLVMSALCRSGQMPLSTSRKKRRSAVVVRVERFRVWRCYRVGGYAGVNQRVSEKNLTKLNPFLVFEPISRISFLYTLRPSEMLNRLPPLLSSQGRNQCFNTIFDMAELPPAAGRKVILSPLSIAPAVETAEPLAPPSVLRSAEVKRFKLRPISPTDSISSFSSQDLLKKALCRENSSSLADDGLRDVSIPSKSTSSSSPPRMNDRRHLDRHVSDLSMDSSFEEPLWDGDI